MGKNDSTITVIGIAENAKAGAVVISKLNQIDYYVDGLHFWDEQFLGKTVKVTGNLKVETYRPVKSGGDIPQQVEGTRRILFKPKWELIVK